MPEGIAIGKDVRHLSPVGCECIPISLREQPIFFPHGRSIRPKKEERIYHQQDVIAAQQAEAGVNQIAGQIIGMADHFIHAPGAERHVPYQNAFCNDVQEATDSEEERTKCHLSFGDTVE